MSTTPAPAAAPHKTFWDTVLTATPIALTVVATVLAGLSGGEMSRAQYHRALAAENQSKTGDEWAFFQAKKYRATYSAGTASQLQLQSTYQPFTPATLSMLVDRIADDLQNLDNGAGNLLAQLEGGNSKTLREHVAAYRRGVQERLTTVKSAKGNLSTELNDAAVQNALKLLAPDELPAPEGTGKAADAATALAKDLEAINPDLPKAFKAINTHQPKNDLDALCNRISEGQVRQGLETVESYAERFDRAQEPVAQALDRVAKLLDDCLAAQAWAREGAWDLHQEATGPAVGSDPMAGLQRNAEGEAAAANRRAADFNAARLRYNARRYNYEARTNQVSAWLHEIQVNKSGLTAERHRYRSGLFFIGMLLAQAGVTVATLALALRRRSILWSMATTVGLAAVAFAGYVYLFI